MITYNTNVFNVQNNSGTDTFRVSANGNATFAASTNSAQALLVQNSSGVNIFSVDTSNGYVNIGAGNAGESSPKLLVLDSSTTSSDPTEVDGAMYYNSNTGGLRCGTSGIWVNCTSGLISSNTTASSSDGNCDNSTTQCVTFNQKVSLPANYCVPGRVIHIMAHGIYNTTGTPTLGFRLYFGTSTTQASDTKIGASTSAMTAGTNAGSLGWTLDTYVTCVASGTSGQLLNEGMGTLDSNAGTGNATGMVSTSTTGIDTTQATDVRISPAWGTASASNNATMYNMIVTFM